MATAQPLIEFEGEVKGNAASGAPVATMETGEILKAPMGGTILEFKVKPGQAVKVGDTILVYEAMKMENNLIAEKDGVVEELLLNDGDVMSTDQPILSWAAKGSSKAEKSASGSGGVTPVKGYDIFKALHPVEGGTGKAPANLKYHSVGEVIKLPAGSTLEVTEDPETGTVNVKVISTKLRKE